MSCIAYACERSARMAAEIPELSPHRFDVTDREGLRAHLVEHGYACVKEAARPHELEQGKNQMLPRSLPVG